MYFPQEMNPQFKNIYHSSFSNTKLFFEQLPRNIDIEYLGIWYIEFTQLMSYLYENLPNNKSIKHLSFNQCKIDMKECVNAVSKTKIEELVFDDCCLWCECFEILVDFLCKNKTLKKIVIRGFRAPENFWERLNRLFRENKTLKEIDFVYTENYDMPMNTWKYIYAHPKRLDYRMCNVIFNNIEDRLVEYMSCTDFMEYLLRENPVHIMSIFLLSSNDEKEIQFNQNFIFKSFFKSAYFDVNLLFIVFEFMRLLKF